MRQFLHQGPRPKLSPGRLFNLLDKELRRRRTQPCACRVPFPVYVYRTDDASANWRIGIPAACPKGCDILIVQIAGELWPHYDLLESAMDIQEPALAGH